MSIYGNEIKLNEAYFGKSKDLLAIEKQLHVVRSKWMASSKSALDTAYIGDFTDDIETQKLNRLFEKAFNINCFAIQFIPSSMINACTLPISYKGDTGGRFDIDKIKKITIVDKNGFKFNKDNELCIVCIMFTGFAFNPKFTDGEILAVILHELGHNFADAIDPKIAVNSVIFSNVRLLLSIMILIMGSVQDKINIISQIPASSNKLTKQMIRIRRLAYENNKPLMSLLNFADGVFGLYKDLVISALYVIDKFNILSIVSKLSNSAIMLAIKPTGYRNEKIADRFVTMHGYGVELTSALSKMETSGQGILIKEVIMEIPVIGGIFNMTDSMMSIILNAFDEHPIWPERLEDQLRALEHELNNNKLDPKMKKEIQNQINEIRAQKNKIINDAQTKNPAVDSSWFKKLWFSLFADGDIKHKLLRDIDSDIDKGVDKLRIKEGYEILGVKQRQFFV